MAFIPIGRVEHAVFDWFESHRPGTKIGTVDLARELGYSRESVFRALIRARRHGWVVPVVEKRGGLGRGHQRRWEVSRAGLAEHRRFQRLAREARKLLGR